jgi:alkylation response protein AidB-like acyl-CoA dehydrogenase
MGSLASKLAIDDAGLAPAPSIADEVTAIARKDLAPLAAAIDSGDVYPADLLRRLGDAGAWSSHVPENGAADLSSAIDSIAALGEVCGATAFMAWCQNTLVWYIANSENQVLIDRLLKNTASGRVLGGTGLSNPMKSFFGIEKLKLRGRKVDGGYVVRGALPWVSNLGPNHLFGTIFEREDAPGEIVMFIADCADPAVTLQPCQPFLAMDGTGTYGVQFRDLFVPDELILADPAGPFVKKIRAGSSTAICRSSRSTSTSSPLSSRARRRRSRAIRSMRTIPTGARWSRCGCAPAKPASRRPTPRCSIAAPVATSGVTAPSAGCARPISSRS